VSRKHASSLAFGVTPSNRRYRLRLSRYEYLAEALGKDLAGGERLVLDAGAGRGRLGLHRRNFAASTPARVRLVGLDISAARARTARDRGYEIVLRGDLLAPLPFRDAAFDAAVCEQVLEHFDAPELARALAELVRVTKPGGCIYIGTPVFTPLALRLEPVWRRVNALARRWRGEPPSTHRQHLSLRQLKRLLERQGLRPERVCGFRLFSLPWNLLEDYAWYYRLQRWLGRLAPGLSVEANVMARTPAAGLPAGSPRGTS
jgi:SAM-dependent methyltransferase